jgi:hypothetical protein
MEGAIAPSPLPPSPEIHPCTHSFMRIIYVSIFYRKVYVGTIASAHVHVRECTNRIFTGFYICV